MEKIMTRWNPLLLLALCLLARPIKAADYPSWWIERGVVDTNLVADDHAYLNQGQIKWLVTNALAEVSEETGYEYTDPSLLPIWDYVQAFFRTNDYRTANRGQLKYAASLFYDCFKNIADGGDDRFDLPFHYPWPLCAAVNDFAPANVGQAKYQFAFEFSGPEGELRHRDCLLAAGNDIVDATCLFGPIPEQVWTGGVDSVVASVVVPVDGFVHKWSHLYLSSRRDSGGGWPDAQGIKFRVISTATEDYDAPIGDSVNITPDAQVNEVTVQVVCTSNPIELDRPVFQLQWLPSVRLDFDPPPPIVGVNSSCDMIMTLISTPPNGGDFVCWPHLVCDSGNVLPLYTGGTFTLGDVTKPFQVAGISYGEDCIRAFPYNGGTEIGKADITAFGIEILEEPTLLFDQCCLVGDLVFKLHPDPEGSHDFPYPGGVEVEGSGSGVVFSDDADPGTVFSFGQVNG